MANLVRPWIVRYVDGKGKRVPKDAEGARQVRQRARKWYAQGVPGWPANKRLPLVADKRAAAKMLEELVQQAERGAVGLPGPAEIAQARRPLRDHLADFEASMRADGTSEHQVGVKIGRIRRLIEGCGFTLLVEIDATRVKTWLARLRERGRVVAELPEDKEAWTRRELAATLGISPVAVSALVRRHRLAATGLGKARRFPRPTVETLRGLVSRPPGMQTSNYYLAAIKSFCRWLVQQGRLPKHPLDILKGGNARLDRRHDRRALPAHQLTTLFAVTLQSDRAFRGLVGRDRFALYLTACGTGFRAGELATLRPESFDLDGAPPTVALPAREDKAGRPVVQPLAPELVAVLREYLTGRAVGVRVWPGTWHTRAYEMIRHDLEAAGIPYSIPGPDGPLFADFHALRHSFVALLDQAGATLKQAMGMARHTDPKLTMARYGRADLANLGEVAARLPALVARMVAPTPDTPTDAGDTPAAPPAEVADQESGAEKPLNPSE